MASKNPSYYQNSPISQEIRLSEHLFHFYVFQRTEYQKSPNQRVTVVPTPEENHFGITAVNDWEIRDGPSMDATLVARAQGVHHMTNMTNEDWHLCFNIVFTDERFKSSSLKVLGNWGHSKEGEWAIVGGTGEFIFAQGAVKFKETDMGNDGNYKELYVRALCLTFPKPSPTVTESKSAQWGGTGGSAFELPAVPRSLDSITIASGEVCFSLAFSYTDKDGKKHSVGPFGGKNGTSKTMNFTAPEVVKGISGTTGPYDGYTVVTSLTIVTNIKTHGPFGKPRGTAFSIQPREDTEVVGLFGRGGARLAAIGACILVYSLRPKSLVVELNKTGCILK